MSNLDSVINDLHSIEPFWDICNPCQCSGCCCMGANISISESEWQLIHRHTKNLSIDEKTALKQNILNQSLCVFRAPTKCLIHDVRPQNCRYTPYQALFSRENMLIYSQVRIDPKTNRCQFQRVEIPATAEQIHALQYNLFVDLPNHGIMTKYISLNWLVAHSELSSLTLSCSEWLKSDPLIL